MILAKTINEMRNVIKQWKREGLQIGLVPTMGYLHEGHSSLIKRASDENDRVVVSIFVNPIQFGQGEDFERYPRDMDHDMAVCRDAGADAIFHPDIFEMYADDFCTYVDMTGLTDTLCGRSRPGHFRGVCTVVNKLFNIVNPDKAYFGQKDAQQLAVIKRMVRDLNIDVEIVGCPTVREPDGLAKSSRNAYLNEQERRAALVLYRSLLLAKDLLDQGERNAEAIIEAMTDHIRKEPLAKIDYVEIVGAVSLQKVNRIAEDILIAIAVFIGKTRLIDNLFYEI